MIPDGTHTAVLDRFEDTQESRVAVLVVEGDERSLGDLLVNPDALPEEARHQDAIVEITLEAGELREMTYDEREMTDRQERTQSRFDRLARRPPADEDS